MSEARAWKCHECGHTEEISYDWLAEHGGPVCAKCDCDMELQPYTPPSEAQSRGAILGLPIEPGNLDDGYNGEDGVNAHIATRLSDKADASGLKAEDLDELVHELAASVAADVNNGGLEEQLHYLVAGLGAQHTERQLDELIADHANPTEEEE